MKSAWCCNFHLCQAMEMESFHLGTDFLRFFFFLFLLPKLSIAVAQFSDQFNYNKITFYHTKYKWHLGDSNKYKVLKILLLFQAFKLLLSLLFVFLVIFGFGFSGDWGGSSSWHAYRCHGSWAIWGERVGGSLPGSHCVGDIHGGSPESRQPSPTPSSSASTYGW